MEDRRWTGQLGAVPDPGRYVRTYIHSNDKEVGRTCFYDAIDYPGPSSRLLENGITYPTEIPVVHIPIPIFIETIRPHKYLYTQ